MDEYDFDFQTRIDELDVLIGQEEKMWEVQGINPQMIMVNMYMMNMKMRMVINILRTKLEMSEEELNVWFKEAVLDQLKEDRKMVTKDMARQRMAESNGHLPFGGIIGPNGQPLG